MTQRNTKNAREEIRGNYYLEIRWLKFIVIKVYAQTRAYTLIH